MNTIHDYMQSKSLNLVHANGKLRWTKSDNGNYLLANRSPTRPLAFEFKPDAKVKLVESPDRLGNYVSIVTTTSHRLTFSVVDTLETTVAQPM